MRGGLRRLRVPVEVDIRVLEGLVPHGLRHTAASLAVAAGADVKVVQQMLGHKSATMTLDLYGHLFDDRLDEVADALDQAARSASTSHPSVVTMPNVVTARS
jgi:integrase